MVEASLNPKAAVPVLARRRYQLRYPMRKIADAQPQLNTSLLPERVPLQRRQHGVAGHHAQQRRLSGRATAMGCQSADIHMLKTQAMIAAHQIRAADASRTSGRSGQS